MSKTPNNVNVNTYIYVLKDPETGTIRYIGKTVKDPKRRVKEHIYAVKKETKRNHRLNWIQSLLNKNLEPMIETIEICSWIESQEREKYWIKYYKDLGFNLVNETEGGEGNLGYVKSKETIEKLKQSLRKDLPKVYQYTLDGVFIKEWVCVKAAAEELNISAGGIRRNAIGERGKYKDFIWSFEKAENITPYSREYKNYVVPGIKHSSLSNIIKQEELNINYNNIFVYNSDKSELIYEGLSLADVANYLKDNLNWTQAISTLRNNICKHIASKTLYNNLFFTYDLPNENYICKSGKLLHLKAYNYNTNELLFEGDGLDDFCKNNDLVKTNVINNIKGKTKSLLYKDIKIKIEYCPINE